MFSQRGIQLAAAASLLIVLPSVARASDDFWDNPAGGNWVTGSNWADNSVPTSSDTANFNLDANHNVMLTGNVTIQALTATDGTVTIRSNNTTVRLLQINAGGGTRDLTVTGADTTLRLGAATGATNHPVHVTVGDELLVSQGAVALQNTSTLLISGALRVADSITPGTTAVMSVFTDASVNLHGDLHIASQNIASQHGWLLAGDGNFFQLGPRSITIGSDDNGTAKLTVGGGGSTFAQFATGTGTLTINPTGTLEILSSGNFDANGDVVVNGGNLTANDFQLGTGLSMTVQNGGQVNFPIYQTASDATYLVTGAGSEWNQTLNLLAIQNGAQLTIEDGGLLSLSSELRVGSAGSGTLIVDGGEIQQTGITISQWALSTGTTAIATFRNNADVTLGGIALADVASSGGVANLDIESGSDVTLGALRLANGGGTSANATVNISGTGTTVTLNPGSLMRLGHSANGVAQLSISDGADLTFGTGGSTILNATATINIEDSTVELAALTDNGGTINFISGSLSYGGDLVVGTGGLLGSNLTLAADRQLALTGTTTIDPLHSLTIAGGSFSTGGLVINGTFAFNSGALGITGAAGLTIGGSGPFGASFTLGSGRSLNVTNTTAIQSAAVMVIDSGATYSTGTLANSGEFVLNGLSVIANAASVQNSGLIRGEGRIVGALTNNAAGEVRLEPGKRIVFDGANAPNAGEINLQDGTAEFTQALTNATGGAIIGRGTLDVGGAGLTNNGRVALSGGTTDVFGNVTNNAAGPNGIQLSGNADVVFWNDVANNAGALIQVSNGSSATFQGEYAGDGISGGGDVNFEADVLPGFSPAALDFGGDVHFASTARLVIEFDGSAPLFQFDSIHADGQIDLDGTLEVQFAEAFVPSGGYTFEILSADDDITGSFDAQLLPDLPEGLIWAVVPAPESLSLLITFGGDFNLDGAVDAADYVTWRKGVGTTYTQADYDDWRANFGQSAGAGSASGVTGGAHSGSSASAVPEPASLVLVMLAVLACSFGPRARPAANICG